MKAPILNARQNFADFFAQELLKSENRRSLLMICALLAGMLLAFLAMSTGPAHFASMGDTVGKRYWLLGVLGLTLAFHLVCSGLRRQWIRQARPGSARLSVLTAIFEPSMVTAWLLIECLIFNPGTMFDSPTTLAYPFVIFLTCLQLSWRLCLLTGLIAAGQYLLMVAWYFMMFGDSMPATVTSYLPLHGMRAFHYLLCGAAAAFLAYEIRRGIGNTLQHLEERDYVVGIFGRYLSDDVVDDILRSPEGLRLGGKRRTVTVMMTDLRGFTSLSESLPPEAVIAMLNNCLATLTEVIIKYHGTIDEFIGDAILALFGAPFAADDDAERAVACAIEMQLAMAEVNQWNAAQGYPALEMGIGIHTGPAVVGNIGSEKRSKYGVVGSTVNLTSRIESYTVGGQILISADTAAAVGDGLQVRSRRQILPKGFNEALEICDVTGISGRYSAALAEAETHWLSLEQPLPVRFVLISGKDVSGPAHQGLLTELSQQGARLVSEFPVEPLSNLRLECDGGEEPLLAKVVDVCEAELTLRFTTALPAQLARLLEAKLKPAGL
ncbi:MAG: hypothetical protein CVV27_11590 [Candidatus Melainabacteria bacterium HGW-Melainabacteria-1]|nr:MAG: hypothetical protein CVV27_11590 [Candidatus Melainabacteria bacterium HGW-Melainabacteria-1]